MSTVTTKERTTSILSAKNLEKRFGKKRGVQDISIEVQGGEIIGLLGPNGAGKTTSFYMIVGLIRANKGTIELNGHNLTRRPMHKRAQMGIGYLPQEPSVFKKLSVEDNLLAILQYRQGLSETDQAIEMEGLLEEFHLTHIRDTLGASLSGGERRRVEIARALAANPRFILLDEPFAGVDPISVIDIQKVVQHLAQRGIGVVITDHNVRETLNVCNRAYIINEGTVIAEGTPEHILENSEVRQVYLGHQFQM
ncbi:MAG: LPS export ABC transporter ATP-binding protein [Gammaproteobacteria bacterium]|jgi:lipopolysaccharide export system ATP-binding protein|nr:LPS export ABC transporter ATP-binding protein [Gammaproteobacteria bacterium]MBT3489396.1 LPS export ABC transporter ATP-binding protein [Gammaproteobacteria bacterium]MBT3718325.1 LPS export ABC transporter ATP-binding protein [Gammaproteobacteria bacterium]MBT3844058.1 LPS export ABC transporter ATP-binding protein [Gammaproteobacteria bacterium]MBT3892202.1 LPS export ABC transporter ATP-binding protein [Gammaproteobacteria bacterium]